MYNESSTVTSRTAPHAPPHPPRDSQRRTAVTCLCGHHGSRSEVTACYCMAYISGKCLRNTPTLAVDVSEIVSSSCLPWSGLWLRKNYMKEMTHWSMRHELQHHQRILPDPCYTHYLITNVKRYNSDMICYRLIYMEILYAQNKGISYSSWFHEWYSKAIPTRVHSWSSK